MALWTRSLVWRLVGEPPAKSAPRHERLRWVRRFYVVQLPITLPVFVLLLVVSSSTWSYVVLGVAAFLWLEGYLSLSLRIRRAQRSDRTTS